MSDRIPGAFVVSVTEPQPSQQPLPVRQSMLFATCASFAVQCDSGNIYDTLRPLPVAGSPREDPPTEFLSKPISANEIDFVVYPREERPILARVDHNGDPVGLSRVRGAHYPQGQPSPMKTPPISTTGGDRARTMSDISMLSASHGAIGNAGNFQAVRGDVLLD